MQLFWKEEVKRAIRYLQEVLRAEHYRAGLRDVKNTVHCDAVLAEDMQFPFLVFEAVFDFGVLSADAHNVAQNNILMRSLATPAHTANVLSQDEVQVFANQLCKATS